MIFTLVLGFSPLQYDFNPCGARALSHIQEHTDTHREKDLKKKKQMHNNPFIQAKYEI